MKATLLLLDPDKTRPIGVQLSRANSLTTIMKLFIGISFVILIGATLDDATHHYGAPWQSLWTACAIAIALVWIIRLLIRSWAKDKLWSIFAAGVEKRNPKNLNEFAASLPSRSFVQNQSVILSDASSYQARNYVVFDIAGTKVTTAELEATYTISNGLMSSLMRGPLNLGITLRVFSFQTRQYMPHIFISSRQQSVYKPSSRNMGLIDEKLPRDLKFQDLEGDFSRYFDIYSCDKSAIDILRVLSPDVMIELRDNGIDFDIEIIDDSLCIYIEPSLVSPEQLELIIHNIAALIQSFSGKLSRNLYLDEPSGSYIPVKRAAFYGSVIAARFSLVVGGYLAYVISAVLIGAAIAFLYTGEFKIF